MEKLGDFKEQVTKRRMSIDVPIDIYKELKIAALERGITVRRYVIGSVLKQLNVEKSVK